MEITSRSAGHVLVTAGRCTLDVVQSDRFSVVLNLFVSVCVYTVSARTEPRALVHDRKLSTS